AGPLNVVPSGSLAAASIRAPAASRSLHSPIASKFSSASPNSSIWAWQPAHTGFDRCCAICSRIGSTFAGFRSSLSSGTFPGDGADLQPLAAEVAHQRLRTWIRQHALELAIQNRRFMQRVLLGRRQQLVVRDAAPQEERQARCEIHVADAIRRIRRGALRLAFEPEQKLRADENAAERELDAGFERRRAALLRAFAEPGERTPQVLVG